MVIFLKTWECKGDRRIHTHSFCFLNCFFTDGCGETQRGGRRAVQHFAAQALTSERDFTRSCPSASCTLFLHRCVVSSPTFRSLSSGLAALPPSSRNNLHFFLASSYECMNRCVQLFGHSHACSFFLEGSEKIGRYLCMISVSVQE